MEGIYLNAFQRANKSGDKREKASFSLQCYRCMLRQNDSQRVLQVHVNILFYMEMSRSEIFEFKMELR